MRRERERDRERVRERGDMHVCTLTGITSTFLSKRIFSAAIVVGPFAPSAITCTCNTTRDCNSSSSLLTFLLLTSLTPHSSLLNPHIPHPSLLTSLTPSLLTPSLLTPHLCLHIPGNVCGDLSLSRGRNQDVTLGCQQVLVSRCGSREAHNGAVGLSGA